MKIITTFTREVIEADKFRNQWQTQKAWIKTILYNSIFFPIADIISSLTLGFIVLYGGMKILNGDTFTTLEFILYTMFITMLFNPLRQIADKMKCN
jgi:ABC-type multidrug transport system fused ATPase/permease subunit